MHRNFTDAASSWTAERRRYGWLIACAGIVALSGMVFIPSLGGLEIWDDHQLIDGTGVGGFHSLWHCITFPFLLHYFRPLVSLSFFVEHRIFGEGPVFCHQTNILLHVAATALLLAVVAEAVSRRAALLAGTLFALQPVQVSTIAWIGGRTDALCSVFVALFALLIMRAVRCAGRAQALYTFGAAAAFFAALLAKEQAISLLPLVPMAWTCFGPQRVDPRPARRAFALFTGVCIAFVALWLLNYPDPYLAAGHSAGRQLLIAGWSMAYYALILFLPSRQWMHTLDVSALQRIGWPAALAGYVAAGAALWLAARWYRRRDPAAWFLALAALSVMPVVNFIPVPSLLVAPYRAGVAGLGAAALVGTLLARPWALPWPQAARRAVRLCVAGAAVCASLALTWWGVHQWQDEPTAFGAFVAYDPDSIIARFNLASALIQRYDTARANTEMEQCLGRLYRSSAWRSPSGALAAVRSDPSIMERIAENQGNRVRSTRWLALLFAQLGIARMQADDEPGALQALQTAYAIDRKSPQANMGLGCIAMVQNRLVDARRYLAVAAAADPALPQAHAKLGELLALQHDWRGALIQDAAWVKLQPWLGDAYSNLATAQSELGDPGGAAATLRYAIGHSICNPEAFRRRIADLDRQVQRPPARASAADPTRTSSATSGV